MPSTSKRPNPDQFKPSPWLSLATVPLLAFLLSGKALAECVQELGQMSEELFRGDRLPNIDFPVTPSPNSEISE